MLYQTNATTLTTCNFLKHIPKLIIFGTVYVQSTVGYREYMEPKLSIWLTELATRQRPASPRPCRLVTSFPGVTWPCGVSGTSTSRQTGHWTNPGVSPPKLWATSFNGPGTGASSSTFSWTGRARGLTEGGDSDDLKWRQNCSSMWTASTETVLIPSRRRTSFLLLDTQRIVVIIISSVNCKEQSALFTQTIRYRVFRITLG